MQNFYQKMADGTIKQINPFTGTEVWSVPGRASKPITNAIPATAKPVTSKPAAEEDYCNFCPKKYLNTPPEKARMVKDKDGYKVLRGVAANEIFNTCAEFRRVPNLFEIVSFDYWQKNFGFKIPDAEKERMEKYLSTNEGKAHVDKVVTLKMKAGGKTDAEIAAMNPADKQHLTEAFFAGSHELIVAGRHYVDGATHDSQLCSSGELTPEQHFQYFKFTIEAMKDIYAKNRYIRYISVFQNWLASAGASFDHLHKQLVGVDDWGISIEKEINLLRANPNIYNELAVNYAGYHNLIVAENENAIAFADIGHRYPTLSIFSKSEHVRPWDLTDEELRGFSDIVHACHAATGNAIPCNEEWYYSPIDCLDGMPWHILLKWRINNPAGFEGGTKIYINAVSPEDLRDKIVPRLFELKNNKKITAFPIAFECPSQANPLRYVKHLTRNLLT